MLLIFGFALPVLTAQKAESDPTKWTEIILPSYSESAGTFFLRLPSPDVGADEAELKKFTDSYEVLGRGKVTRKPDDKRQLCFWGEWHRLTDAGLAHLKNLSALQWLNLGGCKKITDASLALLKDLSALQTLDLSECDKITDAGLAHLKGLSALQKLNLYKCGKITDAGLVHLKSLSSLKELYLGWCHEITYAGVEALKKALPKCKITK